MADFLHHFVQQAVLVAVQRWMRFWRARIAAPLNALERGKSQLARTLHVDGASQRRSSTKANATLRLCEPQRLAQLGGSAAFQLGPS